MSKEVRYNADWFLGSEDQHALERSKKRLATQHNDATLAKLYELVERRIKQETSSSPKTYDKPGWAGQMAHRNGATDMGQYVLDLLAFTKEK